MAFRRHFAGSKEWRMWPPAAGALSLCLEKPYSFVMSAGDSYFTSVLISDVPVSATASTFCSTQHRHHRNKSSEQHNTRDNKILVKMSPHFSAASVRITLDILQVMISLQLGNLNKYSRSSGSCDPGLC